MAKVTFQHKNVAEIAVVTDSNGNVYLKANKTNSTDSFLRWIDRKCDFVKEFASVADALQAGLKCCPIFHGTAGPVPQIQQARWVAHYGFIAQ